MGGPISPCVARISLIEAGRMLHRASGRLKPLPTPAPSVRLHKRGLDWVEPARCPNRDTLQIHLQGAPSAIHMHRWPCARLSCVCKADGSGTTHCRRLSHLQTNRSDPTAQDVHGVAGKSWSACGGLNQAMFGAMGVGEVVGGSSKTAC